MYDVLVIGGGISGLGIAWEAASRGLRTILLEKGGCCSATSANSLRIVHGGLRYMQQLNLVRATRSLLERNNLLFSAPRLVEELPCAMPLNSFGIRSPIPVRLGLAAFKFLHLFTSGESFSGRVVSRDRVGELGVSVAHIAPHGALIWHDAVLTSPAAFAQAIRNLARSLGAEILEWNPVQSVVRNGKHFVVTTVGNSQKQFEAGVVINACGPWIDKVRPQGVNSPLAKVRWCKAFNLEFRSLIEPSIAFSVPSREGRLLFVVPRGDVSALGTGYIPFEGSPDEVKISNFEIEEFLSDFNGAGLPQTFTLQDVEKVEVGVLPMMAVRNNQPVLYGSEIIWADKGYIEVLSTKYTTFRSQAQRVVDKSFGFLGKPFTPSVTYGERVFH